jgi:hypothetical protein
MVNMSLNPEGHSRQIKGSTQGNKACFYRLKRKFRVFMCLRLLPLSSRRIIKEPSRLFSFTELTSPFVISSEAHSDLDRYG